MERRSVLAVLILSFITFGIYQLYWFFVTKCEMNDRGADIPTFILFFIPFANIWWFWKYSEGVARVTRGSLETVVSFLLLLLLGFIGVAIVQATFNDSAQHPVGQLPQARVR